ncbi:hypothetical protein ACFWY6_23785 [Streptomyces sp. NPDC059037]|uniref:hypothetical protein n=1 Tax=Streptomyces sp. NPDC059037 TaxID=3346710 RepID=UPI00367E6E2B
MRTKLIVGALTAGMAMTLASAPSAGAADTRLGCAKHKITVSGSDQILRVYNRCSGNIKVNVHQAGSDSGYYKIARDKSHKFTGGKWHGVCGLKIYYGGTRYYNKIDGDLGDC